jgi:NAD(P)-dependent dehydrogenase (short-subunit alcohol dehydrogenase family)
MNKIALVTGASKGIGLETARQLAQQGIHVLLGARDLKKSEAAAAVLQAEGLPVEGIALDVTSNADIFNAAQTIEAKFGRLDILVNNAGVLLDEGGFGVNTTTTVPLVKVRETFDSNFFGVIALTQALLPLLQKSEAGRIVNLSSILASLTLHATPDSPIYDSKTFAYNVSKTALNGYTVHLAHALKDTPIKVNSAHPGWVKTEMGGEYAPMEITDGAKTSVQLATLPADGPTGGYFHLGETLPW